MRTASKYLIGAALVMAITPQTAFAQRNERKGGKADMEKIVTERLLSGKVISATFGDIAANPDLGIKAQYFIHIASSGKKPEDTSVLSYTTTDQAYFNNCKTFAERALKQDGRMTPDARKIFDLGLKTMYPTVNGVTQEPDAYGKILIDNHYRMKDGNHKLFFISNAGELVNMIIKPNARLQLLIK